MNIKQISIFLENKKGRLAEVTALLAKENINIRALSLADTAEFGILRLIVNSPDKCHKILTENNFVAQKTDVIAVEVEDKPGGLNRILNIFYNNSINIEYMYAIIEKNVDNAIVVFKIDEYEKAINISGSELHFCFIPRHYYESLRMFYPGFYKEHKKIRIIKSALKSAPKKCW